VTTRSTASLTLSKALFFLDRAEEEGLDDRQAFSNYLEAAIVFGRSVTFHLQKQYAHAESFNAWYARQQERMKADPVLGYMLDKRNFILKIGPAGVHGRFFASFTATGHATASVTATIIRGAPWYRRPPRILWRDFRRGWMQRLRRWRRRQPQRRQSSHLETRAQQASLTGSLHFDDWTHDDRSAVALIRYYLGELRPIVEEAEETFGLREDQG